MSPVRLSQHQGPEEGDAPERYTIAEAARLLGISERTVLRRVKTRRLMTVRDGNETKVLLPAALFASDTAPEQAQGAQSSPQPVHDVPSEPAVSISPPTMAEPSAAMLPFGIEQAINRSAAKPAGDLQAVSHQLPGLYPPAFADGQHAVTEQQAELVEPVEQQAELVERRAELVERQTELIERQADPVEQPMDSASQTGASTREPDPPELKSDLVERQPETAESQSEAPYLEHPAPQQPVAPLPQEVPEPSAAELEQQQLGTESELTGTKEATVLFERFPTAEAHTPRSGRPESVENAQLRTGNSDALHPSLTSRADPLTTEVRRFYADEAAKQDEPRAEASTSTTLFGLENAANKTQPAAPRRPVAPASITGVISRAPAAERPAQTARVITIAAWAALTIIIPVLIYRLNTSAVPASQASTSERGTSPVVQADPTAAQATQASGPGDAIEATQTSEAISQLSVAPTLEAEPTAELAAEGSGPGAAPTPLLSPPIPAASAAASVATQTSLVTSTVSIDKLLQQVAQAEQELRSGELQATIQPRNGKPAQVHLRFDLGGPSHVPIMESTTTYAGDAGPVTVKNIRIGERSWISQPDGRWVQVSSPDNVREQIQSFLPQAETATQPSWLTDTSEPQLAWQDITGESRVVVEIALETGQPISMRRERLLTGEIITVAFTGWNTPVEVVPPDDIK